VIMMAIKGKHAASEVKDLSWNGHSMKQG
jgi:hypothetical protein